MSQHGTLPMLLGPCWGTLSIVCSIPPTKQNRREEVTNNDNTRRSVGDITTGKHVE